MDERLFEDGQGWWFQLRGGDRAGPYPDRASAAAALEAFRRRCVSRFELRPSLGALTAWTHHIRSRHSA